VADPGLPGSAPKVCWPGTPSALGLVMPIAPVLTGGIPSGCGIFSAPELVCGGKRRGWRNDDVAIPGHRSCRLSRACSEEHGRCDQNWKCGFHDDLLVEECDSKGDMCLDSNFACGRWPLGRRQWRKGKAPGLSPGPFRPLQKRVGLLASVAFTANPAARAAARASTARARGVKARRRRSGARAGRRPWVIQRG
jgi:hypothetical protein